MAGAASATSKGVGGAGREGGKGAWTDRGAGLQAGKRRAWLWEIYLEPGTGRVLNRERQGWGPIRRCQGNLGESVGPGLSRPGAGDKKEGVGERVRTEPVGQGDPR